MNRRALRIMIAAGVLFTMCGCASMSAREQRVLSGGALGTAAGVGAAAILGGPLIVGAAAGAAAGAVGGVIVDEVQSR